MKKNRSLWHPALWPSWLGMGLGWLLGILPFRIQMAVGRQLGNLAYYLLPSRRHVAAVNLQLCFPEKTHAQRADLLRAHFRAVGMGALETLICWWGSTRKIERLSDLDGLHNLEQVAASGQGILLLSAHFTSLELGVRMAQIHLQRLGMITTAMYKPPHDAVIDYVMRSRRERHIGEASIRHDAVKTLVRALRSGRAVWYAADQRAREYNGIMVPFFAHPARTNVATARLAQMGKARVVPFFTLRRPDCRGYKLIVLAPLDNFPSGDDLADAARINKLIENVVHDAPEQYFWLHKRFQTRAHDPYTEAAR